MESLNNINENNENMIFEQYKLYVEMADKISQQRSLTNSFYITINTALLAYLGIKLENMDVLIYYLAPLGIILSIVWWFNIRSYNQLNSGKFQIIHQMEEKLPFKAYTTEWNILKEGKRKSVYWPISKIEKFIPIVFGIIYVLLIVNNIKIQ